MWSMAGRKVGKGLCSQHGAVEGGQGRSFLLYGVVMRIRSVLSSSWSCSACGAGLERFKVDNRHGAGKELFHPEGNACFGTFC